MSLSKTSCNGPALFRTGGIQPGRNVRAPRISRRIRPAASKRTDHRVDPTGRHVLSLRVNLNASGALDFADLNEMAIANRYVGKNPRIPAPIEHASSSDDNVVTPGACACAAKANKTMGSVDSGLNRSLKVFRNSPAARGDGRRTVCFDRRVAWPCDNRYPLLEICSARSAEGCDRSPETKCSAPAP
jgi:hypothetical protein